VANPILFWHRIAVMHLAREQSRNHKSEEWRVLGIDIHLFFNAPPPPHTNMTLGDMNDAQEHRDAKQTYCHTMTDQL
jgi:hypothetical protein